MLLPHLGLRLPSQLEPSPMLPLDLNQRHLLVSQNLDLPIQDRDCPLNVIQDRIHLNILQQHYRRLIGYTLPQLGYVEGIMDLIQLLQ